MTLKELLKLVGWQQKVKVMYYCDIADNGIDIDTVFKPDEVLRDVIVGTRTLEEMEDIGKIKEMLHWDVTHIDTHLDILNINIIN